MQVTNGLNFGQLLNDMISDSPYNNREFYEKLKIKKVYFYDIIKGRMKPPPAEKQFEIIKILKPSIAKRNLFFELAAKERCEFPADLNIFIDSEFRNSIRNSDDFNSLIGAYIESSGKNYE